MMIHIGDQNPCAILDAERGAVAPAPGAPERLWVKGSSTVYEVVLGRPGQCEEDRCECPGYTYRRRCAHLDAATEFCRRMRETPALSAWVQEQWFGSVIYQETRT